MTSWRPATAGGSSAPLGPESFAPAPGEMDAVDEGWGEDPIVRVPPAAAVPMIPPPLDSGDAPRAPIPTEDFEGGLDFRGELPTLELDPPPARLEMPTVRVSVGAPPREAYRSAHPPSSVRHTLPTVEHSDPLAFDVATRAPPRMPSAVPPRGSAPSLVPHSPMLSAGSVAPGPLPAQVNSQRPHFATEMRARFADADFSGALLFAEALLGEDPAQEEALMYAKCCRIGLSSMYLTRFGSWAAVPSVCVTLDMLRKMEPSSTDLYVFSCVDGSSTLAQIVGALGMAEHEALRILSDFLHRGIIRENR